MTKEQKTVIERIENKLKEPRRSVKVDNIPNAPYMIEPRIYNDIDIETVLSMLKEKDKEIEFQKDIRNTEKNRHKKTEKSLKGIINKQNTELAEKNAEIERLNRQIDLMAEEINETDRGYTDYCEMKIECDRNCKDCIKKYFERKSEE